LERPVVRSPVVAVADELGGRVPLDLERYGPAVTRSLRRHSSSFFSVLSSLHDTSCSCRHSYDPKSYTPGVLGETLIFLPQKQKKKLWVQGLVFWKWPSSLPNTHQS